MCLNIVARQTGRFESLPNATVHRYNGDHPISLDSQGGINCVQVPSLQLNISHSRCLVATSSPREFSAVINTAHIATWSSVLARNNS